MRANIHPHLYNPPFVSSARTAATLKATPNNGQISRFPTFLLDGQEISERHQQNLLLVGAGQKIKTEISTCIFTSLNSNHFETTNKTESGHEAFTRSTDIRA